MFFDQLTETAIVDERLRQAAQVNPEDKFFLVFINLLEALMFERMDQNEAIVARHMGDREFQRQVAIRLAKRCTESYAVRLLQAEIRHKEALRSKEE